jgi:hypothetical protein
MTQLDSLSKREREALNHAVSAVYFSDGYDYKAVLWGVVAELKGIEVPDSHDIYVAFQLLNPEE